MRAGRGSTRETLGAVQEILRISTNPIGTIVGASQICRNSPLSKGTVRRYFRPIPLAFRGRIVVGLLVAIAENVSAKSHVLSKVGWTCHALRKAALQHS